MKTVYHYLYYVSTSSHSSVGQAVPDIAFELATSTLTDISVVNGQGNIGTKYSTSTYQLGQGNWGLTNRVRFKLSDLNDVYTNSEVTPRSCTCFYFIKYQNS